MNKFPNGKPRVMHGGHKLLAQARALPPGPLAAPPVVRVTDAQAQAALDALLLRLRIAEHRVIYTQRGIDTFRQQVSALPADNPVRMMFENMLRVLEELLAHTHEKTPEGA